VCGCCCCCGCATAPPALHFSGSRGRRTAPPPPPTGTRTGDARAERSRNPPFSPAAPLQRTPIPSPATLTHLRERERPARTHPHLSAASKRAPTRLPSSRSSLLLFALPERLSDSRLSRQKLASPSFRRRAVLEQGDFAPCLLGASTARAPSQGVGFRPRGSVFLCLPLVREPRRGDALSPPAQQQLRPGGPF
jgi:hypothetical protein